jgi:hypothetical protein
MATDAQIIAAVERTEGNRVIAARALGISPKVLRYRIERIGPAKFPPPWSGGKKPGSEPPPRRLAGGCNQSTVSENLILAIHETLEMGTPPAHLLGRIHALLVAITGQTALGDRWTPERLAGTQVELERAFLRMGDSP